MPRFIGQHRRLVLPSAAVDPDVRVRTLRICASGRRRCRWRCCPPTRIGTGILDERGDSVRRGDRKGSARRPASHGARRSGSRDGAGPLDQREYRPTAERVLAFRSSLRYSAMNLIHSARPSASGSSHSALATTGTPAARSVVNVELSDPPVISTDGWSDTTRSASITPIGENSTTWPASMRAITGGLMMASNFGTPVSTSSRPRSARSGTWVVDAENSVAIGTGTTTACAASPDRRGVGAPHCSSRYRSAGPPRYVSRTVTTL
jgi:hypothetical protein